MLKHATTLTHKRSPQFDKNFEIIPNFDNFVQSSISEGKFKNVSEVIRAGLRLFEEESKVIALKNAIQEEIDYPNKNYAQYRLFPI